MSNTKDSFNKSRKGIAKHRKNEQAAKQSAEKAEAKAAAGQRRHEEGKKQGLI